MAGEVGGFLSVCLSERSRKLGVGGDDDDDSGSGGVK